MLCFLRRALQLRWTAQRLHLILSQHGWRSCYHLSQSPGPCRYDPWGYAQIVATFLVWGNCWYFMPSAADEDPVLQVLPCAVKLLQLHCRDTCLFGLGTARSDSSTPWSAVAVPGQEGTGGGGLIHVRHGASATAGNEGWWGMSGQGPRQLRC